MNIILIPGLLAPSEYLHPLRDRLEAAGHNCYDPGFRVNTLLNDELHTLVRRLDDPNNPMDLVLVGHSAGGLLGVQAAQALHPSIAGVIGMGTPLTGLAQLEVPHYEARSLTGLMMPLVGPDEVKTFPVLHSALPLTPCVQEWILAKLEEIGA